MAYGLRALSNAYVPNGSGRDWFFVGDFEYRKGARTPLPNEGKRPERAPRQKLGRPPVEVRHGNACGEDSGRAGHATKAKVERWNRRHAEPTNAGTTATSSPSSASASPGDAALAGTASRRAKGRLGGSAPPSIHTTAYQQLGKIPGFVQPEWGVPEKHLHHASPCFPNDQPDFQYDNIFRAGDWSRGIKGSTPHHHATYHELGHSQRKSTPEMRMGTYPRHQFHATPCFPDRAVRMDGNVAQETMVAESTLRRNKERPMPSLEGDFSNGFRGPEPHFSSTYSYHGRLKDFKPKTFGECNKHHHHSTPVFSELEAANRPAAVGTDKLGEGNFTNGFTSKTPHFHADSFNLGQDPTYKSTAKRHDCGAIAQKNYRFTMW